MKLGRFSRTFDSRVPHFSALVAGSSLPAPPPSVDYTQVLPANLGMYGNDVLGNCTAAGIYHANQVWSANTGSIDSEPDDDAVLLYEQASGYIPGNPSTDQGGVEQQVLHHVYRHGFPAGVAGASRSFIHAYVEIDPRNLTDVKTAIAGAGLVYIGFDVPNGMPMAAGSTWDYTPGQKYTIEGGHCVVLPAYDDATQMFKAISWGSIYQMSYAFFTQFVDELYMLVDLGWFESTGLTPGGLTFAQLSAQMAALRSDD